MILSIETAVEQTGVGLSEGGQLVDSLEGRPALKASEILHTLIRELLDRNRWKVADLTAVSVNGGPGSYTGLRIGASAAKGLCYAADLPLVHLDGLQLLVSAAVHSESGEGYEFYAPMIDARRNEVFTGLYRSDLSVAMEPGPKILTSDSYRKYANHSVFFIGNGSDKAQSLIGPGDQFHFSGVSVNMKDHARLADRAVREKKFVNSVTYAPNYLKKFFVVAPRK